MERKPIVSLGTINIIIKQLWPIWICRKSQLFVELKKERNKKKKRATNISTVVMEAYLAIRGLINHNYICLCDEKSQLRFWVLLHTLTYYIIIETVLLYWRHYLAIEKFQGHITFKILTSTLLSVTFDDH